MSHQLKITLEDLEPPVWRRVVVPSTFTLFDLHCVVQVAMGWDNSHLHEFTIKRQRYSLPDEDFGTALDETTARLGEVATARTKIQYLYDFGDSWRHVIVVEKVVAGDDVSVPRCVDGARACPPEDSGGSWGYSEKLQTLADPDDPDREDIREWLGEDFDPEKFSIEGINREFVELFKPAASRKKRSSQARAK